MAADTGGVNGVALARADRPVPARDRGRLHGQRASSAPSRWSPSTSGAWAAASSARGSRGSCSAATSTRRYTFVAVPAAMFATGAVAGFFAVPYTIVLYPIIFIFMARLWSVSHRHGYVTTADFVRGQVRRPRAVARRRGHRLRGHDALHRAAARRHPGGARGGRPRRRRQHRRQGRAALHRLRAAGGLHLLQRPPRPGGDRVREGHPDLPRHHRGDRLPARPGRRLGRIFGAAQDKMEPRNEVTGKPNGAFIPGAGQYWAYATLALGSAMALFMYPHSVTASLSSNSPQHDPPQRRHPAGVLLRARPAGPARLGRDRGGHAADRPRRRAQRAAGDPAAVRGHVPVVVRRRRLRRHRDRRAGAGRDHVDRRGQHVQPQHLQGVAQARRDAGAGGQGLQADVAAGEGVRAGLRAHARQAERDQLPAARRHLDPADLPGGGVQPLHPLVPPLRPARGLGGRHGLRHGRGLPGGQPGDRQALRRLARP